MPAQGFEQRVVARQGALQFGQFLALGEQALGQRLLGRQHALAQPPGEGVLANGAGLFEAARLLQIELRPAALHVIDGHHAVEGRQIALADALLQRDAGNAEQMRGTGNSQPLGHSRKHSNARAAAIPKFLCLQPQGGDGIPFRGMSPTIGGDGIPLRGMSPTGAWGRYPPAGQGGLSLGRPGNGMGSVALLRDRPAAWPVKPGSPAP